LKNALLTEEISLGISQNSRDGFELLYNNEIIDEELNKKTQSDDCI